MANRARAETEITLHGEKYRLRASFEAIAEIEDRAGVGVPYLMTLFAKGTLGYKQITAIIYGGMRAAGETDLTFDQVGELVVQEGLGKLAKPIAEFLSQAVTGGKKREEDHPPGKGEKKMVS